MVDNSSLLVSLHLKCSVIPLSTRATGTSFQASSGARTRISPNPKQIPVLIAPNKSTYLQPHDLGWNKIIAKILSAVDLEPDRNKPISKMKRQETLAGQRETDPSGLCIGTTQNWTLVVSSLKNQLQLPKASQERTFGEQSNQKVHPRNMRTDSLKSSETLPEFFLNCVDEETTNKRIKHVSNILCPRENKHLTMRSSATFLPRTESEWFCEKIFCNKQVEIEKLDLDDLANKYPIRGQRTLKRPPIARCFFCLCCPFRKQAKYSL